MTRSRLGNVFIAAFLFLVPLVGVPSRLLHPGPWLGFLAATVVLLTQPPLGPGAMVRDRSDRFSALLILVAVVSTQIVLLLDYGYRKGHSLDGSPSSVGLGIAAVFLGLALRTWSIRTLGNYFTSTVRVQDGQTVVKRGPYRVLRHPSYTGMLLICLGLALVMRSLLGVLLSAGFVLPAYLYRIYVEERSMLMGTGDAYRTYRSSTWSLFPLVH